MSVIRLPAKLMDVKSSTSKKQVYDGPTNTLDVEEIRDQQRNNILAFIV